MDRLTELIDIDGMEVKVSKERPLSKQGLGAILHKLYALENLEDELGCPLEVVFKALKEGAYFKTDYYGINITYHILEKHEIDFKNNIFDIRKENLLDNKPYYTGGFIFNFKDYGTTWWLKGDMVNEED